MSLYRSEFYKVDVMKVEIKVRKIKKVFALTSLVKKHSTVLAANCLSLMKK